MLNDSGVRCTKKVPVPKNRDAIKHRGSYGRGESLLRGGEGGRDIGPAVSGSRIACIRREASHDVTQVIQAVDGFNSLVTIDNLASGIISAVHCACFFYVCVMTQRCDVVLLSVHTAHFADVTCPPFMSVCVNDWRHG